MQWIIFLAIIILPGINGNQQQTYTLSKLSIKLKYDNKINADDSKAKIYGKR
jgi:hypothetical protein